MLRRGCRARRRDFRYNRFRVRRISATIPTFCLPPATGAGAQPQRGYRHPTRGALKRSTIWSNHICEPISSNQFRHLAAQLAWGQGGGRSAALLNYRSGFAVHGLPPSPACSPNNDHCDQHGRERGLAGQCSSSSGCGRSVKYEEVYLRAYDKRSARARAFDRPQGPPPGHYGPTKAHDSEKVRPSRSKMKVALSDHPEPLQCHQEKPIVPKRFLPGGRHTPSRTTYFCRIKELAAYRDAIRPSSARNFPSCSDALSARSIWIKL